MSVPFIVKPLGPRTGAEAIQLDLAGKLSAQTLKDLEAKGQAAKIYDGWFGPQSATPLTRNFKIGDKS